MSVLGVSKKDLLMVIVLLCGTLLAVLNQTFLSPALPAIMGDLGVSATTAQWLTSGFSLTMAVVIPLSAFLMGRFKTKTLFVASLCFFAAGSGLCAIAPNFGVLLLGRVLQACCTGVLMPMVTTVILLVFPREKRGTAMGIVGLIIGFAPALGPSIAGLLIDNVGWRALFATVFFLVLVVIVLGLFALRSYGNFERVRFDLPSVLLSSVGLVCLLYGLSTFTSSDNMALTVALVIVGVVLVAFFAKRQLKLEQPMLRVSILKNPTYCKAVCIIVLVQLFLMGMTVILPLYIQGVLGQSATVSGVVMLPGAMLGALFGLVAGTLRDRFGARKVAIPGACVMTIGAIGLPLLGVDSAVLQVAATYTIFAMGLQMTTNPVNTWGLNSLDNSVLQHAQGLSNTFNQVAASFGTALLVSISSLGPTLEPTAAPLDQAMAGYHLTFCVTAVLLVIVLLAVVFLVRDKKQAAQPAKGSKPESAVKTEDRAADAGQEEAAALTVADAMNPGSPSILASKSMRDAVRVMAEEDVSDLPVVDEEGHVVGFISDGDVARFLGSNDASLFDASSNTFRFVDNGDMEERFAELLDRNVMTIATKRVFSVAPGDPLDYACRVMAERKFKKLPVVKDGIYVGSLSRRNVVHAVDSYAAGGEQAER